MLDLGSIAVSAVLSIILTAATLIIVSKKLIVPMLIGVFEEKFKDAQGAITRGMSALGKKSGEVRGEKALENAVFEDILDEYPEFTLILDMFSPDTAEMIQENPRAAANLIMRYKPLIDQFLGSKGEKKSSFDL